MSDCHPTPPMLCTTCGYKVDRAASVFDDEGLKPEPGAVSICFGCGAVNIFTEDMRLRPMGDHDLEEMSVQELRQLTVLRMAIFAFRKVFPVQKETKQ